MDACARGTCSISSLATASVRHNDGAMADTLPTAVAFELIDSAATALCRSPEHVQSVLDSFDDCDITDVFEAMQALGTSDVDILSAYLTAEAVLDDGLDDWLDEVG